MNQARAGSRDVGAVAKAVEMSRWGHHGSILIRQRLLISRPAFSTSRHRISKAFNCSPTQHLRAAGGTQGIELEWSEFITASGLGHKYSEESNKSDLAGRTSAGPAAANERGT
jgi:hypothetical protein